jgi:adenylate kinase
MKPKAIIFLGPPGSGKGTQANLLADKFGFYHLETSKLLEQVIYGSGREFVEVEGKKYFLKDERKRWESGKLNSTPFVFHVISEKIQQIGQEKRGLILSASPRTLEEGQRLMPLLEKVFGKENIEVIYLDLSQEQSVWRNSHRRICELMRHPILYLEENKGLVHCPLDGSKLIQRKLDDPNVIVKRYQVFQEQTLPLLDFMTQNGFEVKKVNGEPSVADVFDQVLKVLEE